MAYIGRQLVRGQNRIYDDISSSFNGSTTAFNLTIGGDATPPAQVNQLWIVLGGILQKPGTDFTVADAQVTFTTAPAAGLDFWAMIQGDTSDMNAPSDGSVTPTKIATSGDFSFPADIRLTDADGSHYVGIQAPTTVSSNLVWTLPAADGSANQILKTNGSGVLGWATDSATDSTKMPLAGGTFTGNVTFNDSIEARFGTGADLKIYHDGSNSIISDTGTGNLYIDATSEYHIDNKKVVFGTGADLQLYHDGSNSYITNATGNIAIEGKAGETSVKCIPDGAVELYHNSGKRLATTSNGVEVHGAEGGDAALYLYADEADDNADKWRLRAPNGSSGAPVSFAISNYFDGAWETNLVCTSNGAVELYYNNGKRFETTSSGVSVPSGYYLDVPSDSGIIRLGANNDLQILHDGSSCINASNGHFYIRNNVASDAGGDIFLEAKNGETSIKCQHDGYVELYYDNSMKATTTSSGLTVTGSANSAVDLVVENTNNSQNAAYAKVSIKAGDNANMGGMLQLECNGAYHEFESRSNGTLYISDNGTTKAYLDSNGHFGVSDGDLVIGTDGHGIDFSATGGPSNGSGTSELLDDYEEGTWTPALTNGPTLNGTSGRYVKIGNTVWCYWAITTSNDGTAAHVRINNLPFGSTATNPNAGGTAWDYRSNTNIHAHQSAGGTNLFFYQNSGAAMEGNSTDFESEDFRACTMFQV